MELSKLIAKNDEEEKQAKIRFLQILPTLVGLLGSYDVISKIEKEGLRVDWKALVEAMLDASGYEPRSAIVVGKVKDEVQAL